MIGDTWHTRKVFPPCACAGESPSLPFPERNDCTRGNCNGSGLCQGVVSSSDLWRSRASWTSAHMRALRISTSHQPLCAPGNATSDASSTWSSCHSAYICDRGCPPIFQIKKVRTDWLNLLPYMRLQVDSQVGHGGVRFGAHGSPHIDEGAVLITPVRRLKPRTMSICLRCI